MRRGFSMVEVMLVVAIIGILASIAMPNLLSMQLRAKRAELIPNIDGIKRAELAYDAANDGFIAETTWRPDALPGKQMRTWTTGTSFELLGWVPSGDVRGSYKVVSVGTNFVATGECDIDGDDTNAVFTATKSTLATQLTGQTVY